MSRVFVVQEPLKRVGNSVIPRINYNTLTPYGELQFLFTWGELKEEDALEDTAPMLRKLREALNDFTDSDYIVCLGNPALCAMAIAVAIDINNGRCRVLDWIRNEHRYRVVTMDLDADLASRTAH